MFFRGMCITKIHLLLIQQWLFVFSAGNCLSCYMNKCTFNDMTAESDCSKCPCCTNRSAHISLHMDTVGLLPSSMSDWVREATFTTTQNTICSKRVQCIAEFVLKQELNDSMFEIRSVEPRTQTTGEQCVIKGCANSGLRDCTDGPSYMILVNALQKNARERSHQLSVNNAAKEEHFLRLCNKPRKFDMRRNVEYVWGERVDVSKDEKRRRGKVKRMLFMHDYLATMESSSSEHSAGTGLASSVESGCSSYTTQSSSCDGDRSVSATSAGPYEEFHQLNELSDMRHFIKGGYNAVFDYTSVEQMNGMP